MNARVLSDVGDEDAPASKHEEWKSLFTNNWVKGNGCDLYYMASFVAHGRQVIKFYSSEVATEVQQQENSLDAIVRG